MDCTLCPSLCGSRTRIVLPDLPDFGRPCRFLVVGEAPGEEEDLAGKGFVGRAGRTLSNLLIEYGWSRGIHYGCANVVRCRPPDNRRPTPAEISTCLTNLIETIALARPQAILAVGSTATEAILGVSGLSAAIGWLRQYDHDPVRAGLMEHRPMLEAWPSGMLLFPMPHTSPLAWNRNAPDGRKWSEWGRDQVRRMTEKLKIG